VEEILRELRGLGIPGLYESWKCAEHHDCPEGVEPALVDSLLFTAIVEPERRASTPPRSGRNATSRKPRPRERRRVPVPA